LSNEDAIPEAPQPEVEKLLEPVDADSVGIDLPDDHEEAIGVLLDALSTVRESANAYLDDLQRVAAEYENYRKRIEREREDIVTRSSQRVVESLLPVLDSFDQAFAQEAQTPGEEKILAGIHSTFHLITETLAKEGLERIPTLGEAFDPTVHEAVAGGGDGDLVVTEELRAGYTLNGRVLRAAIVTVASFDEVSSREGDREP
jgi:molecular chaperone GrpE